MEFREMDITICSANGLEDVRGGSWMKVYAVVSIAGNPKTLRKTPEDRDGGRNPTWNFATKYALAEAAVRRYGTKLVVKLYCKRTFGADIYVGEVNTSIKKLFDAAAAAGGNTEMRYRVKRVGSADSEWATGTLTLSCSFGEMKIAQSPSQLLKMLSVSLAGAMLLVRLGVLVMSVGQADIPIDIPFDFFGGDGDVFFDAGAAECGVFESGGGEFSGNGVVGLNGGEIGDDNPISFVGGEVGLDAGGEYACNDVTDLNGGENGDDDPIGFVSGEVGVDAGGAQCEAFDSVGGEVDDDDPIVGGGGVDPIINVIKLGRGEVVDNDDPIVNLTTIGRDQLITPGNEPVLTTSSHWTSGEVGVDAGGAECETIDSVGGEVASDDVVGLVAAAVEGVLPFINGIDDDDENSRTEDAKENVESYLLKIELEK